MNSAPLNKNHYQGSEAYAVCDLVSLLPLPNLITKKEGVFPKNLILMYPNPVPHFQEGRRDTLLSLWAHYGQSGSSRRPLLWGPCLPSFATVEAILGKEPFSLKLPAAEEGQGLKLHQAGEVARQPPWRVRGCHRDRP